jgi:hypothetical protein
VGETIPFVKTCIFVINVRGIMQQGFHIRCYDYYTAPDSGTFVDCCALYLTLYVCLMCNALEENSLHTHYCLVQAHSVICLVHSTTLHEVIMIPVYTLIFAIWNFCSSCIYGCPCFATVHMYHSTHVPQYTCTTVHMYLSTHVLFSFHGWTMLYIADSHISP